MSEPVEVPSEDPQQAIARVVEELGVYPIEAYEFLSAGLRHTVLSVHGDDKVQAVRAKDDPEAARDLHVTGQQLCLGLRDLAWQRWGRLAATVLKQWNITATIDFGRMVFALIDHRLLSRTETDSLEDFRNVYRMADMERDYAIPPAAVDSAPARRS